jgi:hypothetical protein
VSKESGQRTDEKTPTSQKEFGEGDESPVMEMNRAAMNRARLFNAFPAKAGIQQSHQGLF